VGRFGWDGGLGTSWYIDPREEMVTILLTQASFTSAIVPVWVRDFATTAYQAISA
jgi:CubicO group peptidase (beta-lactamase class C family)